ncbi:ABC transporter ATP-binding protein [Cohnella lupini]|uniref:Energy-coupling factor transport system ATP-binding protein n=1 Tax=Cohnella lupini TaxID=1294267 RepID=A0A3D9HW79_9BACL|nr:ATP-binding cassette domain-containing protein [Cohnella lupini]RED53176.1 energy-coupling factor transport system ATP-binding protein [Cohnella lupini]
MAHYELQKVTFTYPQETSPAISSVSLTIKPGEFVVLCGPSGSGKSTLLRLLKREVSPGGTMSGAILLDRMPIQDWPARELAAQVGLVMQNPDNQLVVDTVEHELAFGMENFGLGREAMRRRMAEMAGFFGLEPLLERKTDELSGGQKQTVNLAAVLMLQPKVLLLDEPLAQLDPLAARELLGMIKRLNEEWGITVIMSEHRIDDLLPLADRVVRMEHGKLAYDGDPRAFVLKSWNRSDEAWASALPSITRWALTQSPPEDQPMPDQPPLTVKETMKWLGQSTEASRTGDQVNSEASAQSTKRSEYTGQVQLAAEGLFYAYDKRYSAVLRGLEWQIRSGDWAVLFGGNGSGKSTLLQLLAGLRLPQRGAVRWEGTPFAKLSSKQRYSSVGYLAQNPVLHFAYDSLLDDLRQAASQSGAEDPERGAIEMAERFGITHLLQRHPHDMSGGEQQLGALTITLLGRPQLLLLDEPTKGLDPLAKQRLGEHLRHIHRQGTTLVMATHDIEFAAAYATRCSLLFHGEIVADGDPEAFFQGNLFYATPLHRLLALWEAKSR